MADFAHGKDTVIMIDAADISEWTNTSEFSRKAETHNVTVYGGPKYGDGRKPNVYKGGLVDATFKCGGVFDQTEATGTAATLDDLEGQTVVLKRRPLGTGAGKPEQTVTMIVTDVTQTSPVADMVTWSLEAQCSGTIVTTDQAA